MQATDYIWLNGDFVPWNEAKIHVLTHSLHYGSGAFEGIRFYATDKGTAVFRLDEHLKRLTYSASEINMQLPYNEAQLKDIILKLIPLNKITQGYIRPIAFYGYGKMGVSPIGAPIEIAIAVWPWGAYLPYEMVDVTTTQYIRVPPNVSKANAKLTGNYLNGIMAILQLQGTHYHEALFLDINGYIAEGPGENFFIGKDKIIYTPKPGNILAGITRDTVMQIAKKLGYTVIEKDITLQEAFASDEAFFTGTAAEISPIHSINDQIIGDGKVGPITQQLKQYYQDVVLGKDKDFEDFLTYVN